MSLKSSNKAILLVQPSDQASAKIQYKTPQLSDFGKVSDLTASGSVNGNEHANQPQHSMP